MNKVKAMTLTAVLTAALAVVAQISIPLPAMPLTLQCFAVALGGYVFGARISTVATVLYIALGAVGLPIFASFRGGAEVLVGVTGGFIWGFLLLALLCGLAKGKKRGTAYAMGLLGLAVCHAVGMAQFCLVTGGTVATAFVTASAPFIIKDALLVWAALALSAPVSAAVFKRR